MSKRLVGLEALCPGGAVNISGTTASKQLVVDQLKSLASKLFRDPQALSSTLATALGLTQPRAFRSLTFVVRCLP